ncbi:YggW family oxidoreductase [Litoribrevibacter albus]|uniref:Heme chaperone HemW n=2 Tax=Litoribrevibacter albus TaxID=1473156 RepID=A0AA37W7H7_9GAMM|nr:YggW family oxidoreductase [Litoribrevibacter albus]
MKPEELPEKEYLERLLYDLEQDQAWAYERPIQSIFIGGGTPSLLSSDFYKTLLSELRNFHALANDIEITMEANPGAVEASRFIGYHEAGINRLSVGVQSFQNDKLTQLGRIHSSENAQSAINALKAAGFENFNIDLMHGLPGQSLDDALFDLQTAIELGCTHLSWYQLTIEPNTEFYSRPPQLPEEETLCDIIEAGQALIAKSGFQQYEVSAYSKPGYPSRHNLNYWQFGDYLAIGAGAHGKITQPDGQIFRYRKVRQPNHYLDTSRLSTTAAIEPIEQEDIPLEFLMNTLRLTQGFPAELFQAATGVPIESIQPKIDQAVQEGLLEINTHSQQSIIGPTIKGRIYLNELLERFLD